MEKSSSTATLKHSLEFHNIACGKTKEWSKDPTNWKLRVTLFLYSPFCSSWHYVERVVIRSEFLFWIPGADLCGIQQGLAWSCHLNCNSSSCSRGPTQRCPGLDHRSHSDTHRGDTLARPTSAVGGSWPSRCLWSCQLSRHFMLLHQFYVAAASGGNMGFQ